MNLNIFSITYAHIFVYVIMIYSIILPLLKNHINEINQFNDYFLSDKFKILLINLGIAFVYLKIAEYLPDDIPIMYRRIIVSIVFDVILNIYISETSFDSTNIRLYRDLTRSTGWFIIIWNVLNIVLTGKIADELNKLEFLNKTPSQILIILVITLVLFHL